MVLQAQITQQPVVPLDLLLEFLYTRLVFKVEVTSNESLVQLDYLTEAQMLARGFVQSPCCLDELRGCIVSKLSRVRRGVVITINVS